MNEPAPDPSFVPISPNPFIVGNPVRGRTMFFGREAEFELVRNRFQHSTHGGLLVFCGERRSGKTSLIRHRALEAPLSAKCRQATYVRAMSAFQGEMSVRVNRVGLTAYRRLPLYPRQRSSSGRPRRSVSCQQRTSSPHSIRRWQSRHLTPFDSEYINRLQEAFEMAGTNVCDMQAIPDAILNGT